MSSSIPQGTKLGRYEIRSQIGSGGMGDVYLALDTELDRMVALKILPAALATDQQRMRRFVQEAKSASSLNHQNIITIYEIGETDSTRFIVTEFIDGTTLRKKMKRGPLGLAEIIEIGIQIASGLAAAHDAGIVHRDIKPENIMLRSRDGFVKVLDFGLVKLTEPSANVSDTEAPTRALVNTDAGTVLGTVHYMSPEQARGKEVDERTDIWSLGVILYEMLARTTPFAGETSTDVIAAIVKSEPVPITRFVPETPEKLAEIIGKALEKDRDDRYQTVKDLQVDLRRLKKRLDFESVMDRSTAPDVRVSLHESAAKTAISQSSSPTFSIDPGRPTSSAEYIVSEIKRHKTGLVFAALVVLAIVVAGIFLALRFSRTAQPPIASMKITKLTSGGHVNGIMIDGSTSISPDGKYIVFTLVDGGKVSLWVRQVSTNSIVQIVPPTEGTNDGTTISNDGEYVYYIFGNRDGSSLYQVPILGGTPRKILERVSTPISFSPDGKQFTFVRELENNEGDALMVANADGSSERILLTRKGIDWLSGQGPSWSPDGKTIACAAGTDSGGKSYMTVMGFSLADSSFKPLTSEKWMGEVRRVIWLRDGSGLVVSARANAQTLTNTQLFFISQPEGITRRITNDLNGYGSVSLGVTADGNQIVTVESSPSVQLWTTTMNGPENTAVKITHGEVDGADGVTWTRDNEIIYFSQTSDGADLSIVKPDGSANRSVAKGNSMDANVNLSPDGKYVFFTSMRSGAPHIWRVNTDGSSPKQLTSGDFYDGYPTCSPDGKWVLFLSWRSGKSCLWKVSSDGGEPVQVSQLTTTPAAYSPDGKFFATGIVVEGSRETRQLAIFPSEGGDPVKRLDVHNVNFFGGLRWASDGRAVFISGGQNRVANIWRQPVDGSAPQQVTDFTSDLIYDFDLSPDGKRLVISRGNSSLDIVLIKDFR